MLVRLFAAAALVLLAAGPGHAQSAATGVAPAQTEEARPKRQRQRSPGAKKREPTVGQMAVRERQRKCAAEWKEAKAAGRVAAGTRWPRFWSQCNARLKGGAA